MRHPFLFQSPLVGDVHLAAPRDLRDAPSSDQFQSPLVGDVHLACSIALELDDRRPVRFNPLSSGTFISPPP